MKRADWMVLALTAAVAAAGCATKKYVRQETLAAEERTAERIEVLQSQMEDAQMDIARHDQQLDELSATTRDALERAIAAGKLAEGKFLFERVLSSDDLQFGFDDSELSTSAREALDAFGAELNKRNENVYIEIQGHTDSTGQRGLQPGARPGAGRGGAPIPEFFAFDTTPPHGSDIVRRDSTPGGQRHARESRSQQEGRTGRFEVDSKHIDLCRAAVMAHWPATPLCFPPSTEVRHF